MVMPSFSAWLSK